MRSGRPRKLSERTAHVLVRKSKPPFDCKNPAARFSKTQERRCTVPPCSDARTNKTFMEESVEENLTCVLIIKSNVRSMKRNIYRSLTCFGNKFCRPMKLKKEFFGHSQQRYVWRKTGAAFHEKKILPTVKHGGGSIMLQGCVAARGAGNTAQVQGGMDSTKCQQILEAKIQPTKKKQKMLKLKRGRLLQQDDDPKHTSKSTWTTSRDAN